MRPGAQERARYHAQGYVSLPPPLPLAQIEALRSALQDWHAPQANNAYGILHNNLWRELPLFGAVIDAGELGGVAAALLGVPEVSLFQDNLIWKPPGTTDAVQWHQDYAYWPLSSAAGVTLWLALEPADPSNGCLHYIPGTHRLGERQPTNFISPGSPSRRTELPAMDWQERQHAAIAAPRPAGGLRVRPA